MYGDDGDTFSWVTDENHPLGSPVTIFDSDCSMRFKNMKLKPHTPMDKYGNHTIDVLQQFYTDEVINEMLRDGVISTGWSEKYLPDTK